MQSTVRPAKLTTASLPSRHDAQSPAVRPFQRCQSQDPAIGFERARIVTAAPARDTASAKESPRKPLPPAITIRWPDNDSAKGKLPEVGENQSLLGPTVGGRFTEHRVR